MGLKHSYIIFHLLSLYSNIGVNAETPSEVAERACQEIKSNYQPSEGNYIVSGKKAASGEFPHIVAFIAQLPEENLFYCGGSLISATFVLTAAHCFDDQIPDVPIIVRFGSLSVHNTKFNSDTDMKVAEKFLHPKYDSSQKYYDIAIIRLPSPVTITINVSPICLETNDADPQGKLVVAGWGKIRTGGPTSPDLLKAYVEAVPVDKCNDYFKMSKSALPQGIVKEQLCANDPTGKKQDACQGDSGGPLIDKNRRLVGITSFGRGCGRKIPGVYTRVSSYIGWIVGIVWPN